MGSKTLQKYGWQNENYLWIQVQAPAGNWVDIQGQPNIDEASVRAALATAKYQRDEYKVKSRVVEKQYRIITKE